MADAPAARRRDAAASRERLLTAAQELFAERGYDKTTARDIGERAQVDPTMIARYFGGKAQLFIAVLNEFGTRDALDLRDAGRVARLVERMVSQGPGAILQAAVGKFDSEQAQQAATEELHQRFVTPLAERLEQEGDQQARLRAEVLVAAFVGVALAQRNGTLATLASADARQITALVQELLGAR